MPLQNRVTPFGELVADPARGLVYGNRGCLHDASGAIVRHHQVRRWIACRLTFKDRRRRSMAPPGRYTALFFLDEATAFAAGHRPCAECRREDYNRFSDLWARMHDGERGVDAIDTRLHSERLDGPTTQRQRPAPLDDLPDGVMVSREGQPWLVLGPSLLRWTVAGYVARRPRPAGEPASVLTPRSLVAVLDADWRPAVPLLHPTSQLQGDQGRSCSRPST